MSGEAPLSVRIEATHRHYKGGYYKVVCEATHTETGERLVVYEHVWPHTRSRFARPYDIFHGLLENGRPRFEPLHLEDF